MSNIIPVTEKSGLILHNKRKKPCVLCLRKKIASIYLSAIGFRAHNKKRLIRSYITALSMVNHTRQKRWQILVNCAYTTYFRVFLKIQVRFVLYIYKDNNYCD